MKKKKEQEVEKKQRPSAGSVIGTIIRSVVIVVGFVLKVLFKAITLLGLWIPIVYALIGVILYFALDFNPFTFDTLGTLYLCGGIACIIGACIIAVRNIIVKPVKSIYEGYKHPLWEKKTSEQKQDEAVWESQRKKKKNERLNPPVVEELNRSETVRYGDLLSTLDDFDPNDNGDNNLDWLPKNVNTGAQNPIVVSAPSAEKPQVYFSALEPDVLVHEYSDRFELFKVVGKRTTPIGVEYK